MRNALLIAVALLGAVACDNATVLANIDTYTCAWLPGAVDCTDSSVHNKAVSILHNGIIAGQIKCSSQFDSYKYVTSDNPLFTINSARTFILDITKFQDDSYFVNWSVTGSIGFIARSDANTSPLTIGSSTDTVTLVVSGGDLTFISNEPSFVRSTYTAPYESIYEHLETVVPLSTCSGFNKEVFE